MTLSGFESSIDFGQVCTSLVKSRSFFVTNDGRRPRQISFLDWAKASGKRRSAEPSKFTVLPNELIVEPGTTVEV